MERNLDRRVEVMVPIEDASLQGELREAFEITWRDDLFTWYGHRPTWRRLQPVNKPLGAVGVQTSHDGSFPLAFAGVISVGRRHCQLA